MPAQLNARILELDGDNPGSSIADAYVAAPFDSIGLCFSGGGSRALTCAMGQLRALHTLGLMDQVFAISSVSGGTWASATYAYLPSTISDDDFLGLPVLDPSKLTVHGDDQYALEFQSPHNLGRVPTGLGYLRDLDEILRLWRQWGYPIDDLWQGLIGDAVLKPFGLWQPDPNSHYDPHYFTYTEAYLQAAGGLLKRNPELSAGDFYASRAGRPFLVMNTSMFTDDGPAADLLPFEANFSLGVRQRFPSVQDTVIGGGFVESLAMTGKYVEDAGPGEVLVQTPARPFTLADMVGLSSAAFAQLLEERFREFDGIVPRYNYWPVATRETVGARTYRFADGGSLENLGLNVMLARGVSRLLVFINTDEAISAVGNEIRVSSDLPPLFGFQPFSSDHGYLPYAEDPGRGATRLFRHNQVFAAADFEALKQQLLQAKQVGGPVIVRQTLQVQANAWYGVAGGRAVEILWVYNDKVQAFWEQLSLPVRLAIDFDGKDAFPLYNTFTQLELPAVAVNALAHLSCWNLAADWKAPGSSISNADRVRAMFD
jgi:hypothetical protein